MTISSVIELTCSPETAITKTQNMNFILKYFSLPMDAILLLILQT